MNWGHKILIAFILFGTLIITLVVISVRTDFHLVSADYYQQELDFETQLIQTRNTQALITQPEMAYSKENRQLQLIFPEEVSRLLKEGRVSFFRPSDADIDFETKLTLDASGQQKVDLSNHKKGLWRIELTWSDQLKEYYMEKKIYL